MRYGRSLERLIEEAMQEDPPTRDEERALYWKMKNGVPGARDELVTRHMRFVMFLARHFSGHGVDLEDLVQDGVMAMCEAADKWDARRGMRFTGFAGWLIKNAMKASLSLSGSAVSLPQVNYSHSRAKNVLREMQSELGRMPTTGEFKKRSGMPGNFAAIMLVMTHTAESLEDPVFAHDEASPYQRDHVVEPRPGPAEEAESSDIRRWLDSLISGLNERERDVIQKRFGWHDDVAMVLDDIGASRGVTREAVRQTQLTAIRKMRAAIVQGDLEVSARMVG